MSKIRFAISFYDSVFNFVDKGLVLLKTPNTNAVTTQDVLLAVI